MTTTTIGIALVEHAGRYLVGTRSVGQVLAGCAEFPGGKCEPGESPRDCAVRECREETGLPVVAVELFQQIAFRYPHGDVDLHFWLCRPEADALISAEQQGYRWVPSTELAGLNFPDANRDVIAKLIADSQRKLTAQPQSQPTATESA